MLRRILVAGMAALVACNAAAAERTVAPAATVERNASGGRAWAGDLPAAIAIGDPAPEFSYLGTDGSWHDFRNLVAAGPVLLVFGARDDQLVELDRARAAFGEMGVRPVAVLDMRTGSAARRAHRLGLGCGVIADPQCAIASLYASLDPVTQRHGTSYFIVDGRGTIRADSRALPDARRLLAITASSLGRPLADPASLPALQ